VTELLVRAPTVLDRDTRLAFRREALAVVETRSTGRDVGGRVVVDLAGTRHVDSAGLGALVLVRERAAEQRWTVCLRGASEELRFLLVLTRLEDRFEFEPPAT
jgi:anti-anti-sigma factor